VTSAEGAAGAGERDDAGRRDDARDSDGGGSLPTAPAMTALTAAAAIADGELTSEQLVADCLDRIAAREDTLRAWAHLDPDRALAEARARDDEPSRGPLHGVPVGIKDLIDTADQPTRYGSPIYATHQPTADAECVDRLRRAGAVVIGKTVTTEFAVFHPGPTTHPQDPTRTPGGSSSGSAAAVAAGTIPLALGTQTAGSVVRPASFCGVFGGKPTFGTIPTDGVKACSTTLDHVGAFGRDAADVAVALGVMSDDIDRFRPVDLGDRPRIGFCRTPWWDELEPTTRATLEAGAESLARSADVVEVTLPAEFAGLVDAQRTIMGVELRRNLAWERTHHPELLSDDLRTYLEESAALEDGYDDALELARRCRAQLAGVFTEPSVLLAPSVLGEPPPIATTGDPLLCRAWTLLGTPSVSVPGLTGPTDLPVGVQVVTAPDADGLALTAAAFVAPALALAGSSPTDASPHLDGRDPS
jgi:Asp-tRNA(Asn)/Glu-tRNA(Gln) amidotransferase A subunit family amidase